MNCNSKIDGLATFAGRVGFAVDHALIYLKGGGAWAHEKFAVSNNSANPLLITCGTNLDGTPIACPVQGGSISASRWGWMIGTGIEYMFAPNWSAKIEYNFLDLGTKSYVINDAPPFDIKSQIHEVKFGVNWHFWQNL